MPQGPEPEQEVSHQRLEDMPEFQKLAPEQQEKLLALRERMMAEAMDPKAVVTRNIDEMGFWEGLKETVKPYQQKSKDLAINDLKAGASLAISLIPVLGEGKGLGTGLFGIGTKENPAVVNGMVNLKTLHVEPIERGKRAWKKARLGYNISRSKSAVEIARIGAETAGKKVGILKNATAHVHDALQPLPAYLAGKTAAELKIIREGQNAMKEGTRVLTENLTKKAGVDAIAALQKSKAAESATAYMKPLTEAGLKHDLAWYNLFGRLQHREAIHAGTEAAKVVKATRDAEIAKVIAEKTAGHNIVRAGLESQFMKKAPGIIETTAAASKNTKLKLFFDRWLNLTPDVPVWLTTTTGLLEMVGMQGIDMIPAAIQLEVNSFKRVMMYKDMAMDVLGYTLQRGMRNMAERKQAADTFVPQVAPAAA